MQCERPAALADHPQWPIRNDFHEKSRWNFTALPLGNEGVAFEFENETFFVASQFWLSLDLF